MKSQMRAAWTPAGYSISAMEFHLETIKYISSAFTGRWAGDIREKVKALKQAIDFYIADEAKRARDAEEE